MKDIPFHKPHITEEEIAGVVEALKSGWLTMGPQTLKFEEEFSHFLGSKHSISLNSCTAALHLALKVIGLDREDEVIVPTTTFTSTAEVVCYFGAKPVIVDVERDTHNIDVSCVERAITDRTRAIIPVHFAGQPCDMDEIMNIAEQRRLHVIEDAAHAIPAKYHDRYIGTIGDMTCFSFYATKTLTTGEGGMITTANDAWAERLRSIRQHGISKDAWKRYSKEGSWYYEVLEAGYKYNMTDIQASLGLAQLKKQQWMLDERNRIADKYTEAFKDSDFIGVPLIKPGRSSAWHLYIIKLNIEALRINRADFIEELKALGIGTSVHFIPLHRHSFYRETFACNEKDFPNAEWVYERSISLPVYPGMTDSDIGRVIDAVSGVALNNKR